MKKEIFKVAIPLNRVGVSMVEVGKQLWVYEVAIPFNRVGVSIQIRPCRGLGR